MPDVLAVKRAKMLRVIGHASNTSPPPYNPAAEMTQYPYTPPTQYAAGYDYYQSDPLAPARRAGLLMYILGGIVLLSGFCCIGMGQALPKLMAEQPEAFVGLEQIPEATPQLLQRTLYIFSGIIFVGGVGMIVLGRFVRAASKGAIITSIVIAILAVLLLGIWLLGAAPTLLSPPGVHSLGLCMLVVPIALFVLLIVWLFGAMRGVDRAMASSYAMQYWQYAQQQQAYAQGQYPAPPQTPPPTPPPPPPDSLPPT